MKIIALCLIFCQFASADPLVAYSSRPSVLGAPAVDHAPPEFTDDFRRAHLWAAAFLIEMYPDAQIYFLGRDAEQMYDVSLLTVRDDPAARARLHLINVSRAHRHDPNLKNYLAQMGLASPLTQPTLIFDTGHTDKIVNAILGELAPSDQALISAHYLSSAVEWIPSLRLFASWFNRPAEGSESREVFVYPKLIAQGYEDLDFHATDSSGNYALVDGRWDAVSTPLPSTEPARFARETWAHWLSRPEITAESRRLRATFAALYAESAAGHLDTVLNELRALLAAYPRQLAEAVVRDYLELRLKNKPGWPGYLDTSDLNLEREVYSGENDLRRLSGAKLTTAIDQATDRAAYAAADFFTSAESHPYESHLIDLMKRNGPKIQDHVAEHVFGHPGSVPHRRALAWLIENGSVFARSRLARQAFHRPHARAWGPEALLLMKRAVDVEEWSELKREMANYVFSTRNVKSFGEALRYGLHHGGEEFAYHAESVWEMRWAEDPAALKKSLIEGGPCEGPLSITKD